jgi:hypothetical protein
MAKDLIRCPRCKGNGWDPNGGECIVCKGAGVLYYSDASPATDKDADDFFEDYYKSKTKRNG